MAKISIGSSEYNYRIKISKKARYIRIQVSPEQGIELIIPKGIAVKKAENFLNNKKSWILKNINKTDENGKEYRYLGKKINLVLEYDFFIKKPRIELVKHKLLLNMPEGNVTTEKNIFDEWLRGKAKEYIPERVKVLAGRNGFDFNKITIRGQKSRWGSCSKNSNLSFNFKIMSYEKGAIDYIIIHELCHLKEMNHSGKFWQLVESYMPDYKKYRNILKVMS